MKMVIYYVSVVYMLKMIFLIQIEYALSNYHTV